jgi:hypothetical protein
MDLSTTPRFSLNTPYAVGKAFFTCTAVQPFQARLAALPEYDLTKFTLLEAYARSLRHFETEAIRHVQRMSEVPALSKEGNALRSILFDYASIVSRKGGIAGEVIEVVRDGSGPRDLATDLNVLVKELSAAPAGTIGEATPVTFADLDRATTLAHQLNVHVGNPSSDTDYQTLLEERQKAGALLVQAQDEVRRGMTYLRWTEEDVGELVPSLYVTGSKGEKAGDDDQVSEQVAAVHDQLHHGSADHLDPEDNPFTTTED